MASAPANNKEIAFSFTGKTGEYFGIWIVNVLLIIITLGIYTAWAKVRTKRYFYGHTLLDNSPFDYLANPFSILIGWIIGVIVFIAYSVSIKLFPIFSGLIALLVYLFIPWVVVRAMAFRLKNTAYRNIRFSFNKNYREAALVFLGLFILVPITLGLIIPYMVFRQKKFLVENSHYGQTRFSFSAGAWDFYKLALIVLGIIIVLSIVISILGAALSGSLAAYSGGEINPAIAQSIALIPMFLIYLFIFAYWHTAVTNLLWNNIQLEQNQFRSNLKISHMLSLYFSNTIAILCSLGLLVPWARVRTTRYRLSKLNFIPASDLNAFLAAKQQEESAIGEEIGDIMDIDIGF